MRLRDYVLFACLTLFICLATSLIAGRIAAVSRAQADTQRATIVTDQKTGVFRFIIDGQQVAYIDANGFNIHDDIGYGGVITDYGQAEFNRRAAEAGDGK